MLEPLIDGLEDGIPCDTLQAVTAELEAWRLRPVTQALPVLIALRRVFGHVRKALHAAPGVNSGEPTQQQTQTQSQTQGTQGKQRKRRGKRQAAAAADEDEAHGSLLEAVCDFVHSFAETVALNEFHDPSSLEYIVEVLFELPSLEGVRDREGTGAVIGKVLAALGSLLGQARGPGAGSGDRRASDGARHLAGIEELVLTHALPVLTCPHTGAAYRGYIFDMLRGHFADHSQDSLVAMLQSLLVSATDRQRAENRRVAADSFAELFAMLPAENSAAREELVDLAFACSVDQSTGRRWFAIDVAHELLLRRLDGLSARSVAKLLELLLLRFSDKQTMVRTKALSYMAAILELTMSHRELRELFGRFLRSQVPRYALTEGADAQQATSKPSGSPLFHDLLLEEVECRLKEDKALVRKSAIQVLEAILAIEEVALPMDKALLSVLAATSMRSEPSVAVRRQALNCAVSAANQHINQFTATGAGEPQMEVPATVLSAALLPAYQEDGEETVRKQALTAVHTMLIEPLENVKDLRIPCVWAILAHLPRESALALGKVCGELVREGRVKPSVLQTLQQEISTRPGNQCAFRVLANVGAAFPKKLDAALLDRLYAERRAALAQRVANDGVFADILKLMTQASLPDVRRQEIQEELVQSLANAGAHHSLTRQMLATVVGMHHKKSPKPLLQELVDTAKGKVYEFIKHASISDADVCAYLCLIGEIAMLRDGSGARMVKVPTQLETYVKALVQMPTAEGEGAAAVEQDSRFDMSQCNLSSQISVDPGMPQELLPGKDRRSTPLVQACAVQVLGRLCLSNEALAKKCVCAFVDLLHKSEHEATKANCLAVLADISVEFSGSVDAYVTSMAWCMGHRSAFVRHTALTLLTQMLAEGFTKWRASLFFYFLVLLVDDAREVAQMAEYALVHILLPKQANLFVNNFVEALFVLNDYGGHCQYNSPAHRLHPMVHALAGDADAATARRRLSLYQTMLRHMTQPQLFRLHEKLHAEVLALFTEDGAAEDEYVPSAQSLNALSGAGSGVLRDCLRVLCLKEMKLSTKAPAGAAQPDDGEVEVTQEMRDMTGRLFTHVIHKHIELNVVPVVVYLWRWLRRRKSALVQHLEQYLHALFRDHKEQIQTILSADPQLATELQYDLRQQQAQQSTQKRSRGTRRQGTQGTQGTPKRATHPAAVMSPQTPFSPLSEHASPTVKAENRRTSERGEAGPQRVLFDD